MWSSGLHSYWVKRNQNTGRQNFELGLWSVLGLEIVISVAPLIVAHLVRHVVGVSC